MNEAERIKRFEDTTALLSGHFVLSSGLHADKYIAKRRLYTSPEKVSDLCRETAFIFKDAKAEVVVSPAVGGVALSQWVAYHLTLQSGYSRNILAVFAEKTGHDQKEFGFSEGCGEFIANKRVLVVDDILTTGGSIEAVIRAVKGLGGVAIGAGVLWLRGDEPNLDIPFSALIKKTFPVWKPEDCPLCMRDVPFNKLK